jgi:hypothetical protein
MGTFLASAKCLGRPTVDAIVHRRQKPTGFKSESEEGDSVDLRSKSQTLFAPDPL